MQGKKTIWRKFPLKRLSLWNCCADKNKLLGKHLLWKNLRDDCRKQLHTLWFCEAQTFLQVVVSRHFLRFVRKRKKICRLLQLQSKCTGNKTFQNSEASGKLCCWVGESTRKPSARPLQQRNPKRISRKVKYSLKDLMSFFVNCDLWQAMASRCNADVFLTPT